VTEKDQSRFAPDRKGEMPLIGHARQGEEVAGSEMTRAQLALGGRIVAEGASVESQRAAVARYSSSHDVVALSAVLTHVTGAGARGVLHIDLAVRSWRQKREERI